MLPDRYRFTTVKQVLEYYMENHGFEAESWADLAYMTRVFIEVMGRKRLQDLQPEHFNAYISGRKRGSFGKRPARSTGTLRRELTHLLTAINFCARAKLVNPEHVPFIPMPDRPPPRDRWLSKAEIQLLKDAAVPFSRADRFIRIALGTGARKRAIEKLEWDQISFPTNLIDFTKHQERITNKRRVIVPIHSDLRVYLEQLRKKEEGNFVLGTTADVRTSLDAVSHRAGVKGVTPHVFRHTWATHASMNGVPLAEIARILGDSIVTVEKVYAKFQPGYLQQAIEQAAL